jgi:hypothetical protein
MNDLEQHENAMLDHLMRMIVEAEKSDTIAAQNAVSLLFAVLASTDTHKLSGRPLSEPLPIPDWVRAYLAKILYRIMNGEDANKAFRLKRNGRPTGWSFYAKHAAADTVHYFHNHTSQGKSIEESCAIVADGINSLVQKMPKQIIQDAGLGHFIGRKEMSQELISKWHYELQNDNIPLNGIKGMRIGRLIMTDLRNP